MGKMNIYPWLSAIICFAVCFLIGLALATPIYVEDVISPGSKPEFSLAGTDICTKNDCKKSKNGFVSDGDDAYIVFNCKKSNIKAVTANVNTEKSDKTLAVYTDSGNGFSEEEVYTYDTLHEPDHIFTCGGKNIKKIRFDFKKNIEINGLSFYNESAVSQIIPEIKPFCYAVIALVSGVLSVICFIVEYKKKLLCRLFASVKKNRGKILLFIIAMGLLVLFSLLATYVTGLFNGRFNPYLFFYIFGVVAVAFEIVVFAKTTVKHTERLFLAICLTVGLSMIMITPVGHSSWDTETHYLHTLKTVSNNTSYSSADHLVINNDPVVMVSDSFDGNVGRIIKLNAAESKAGGTAEFDFNIANVLSGVALKVAKYFHLPFYISFKIGEMPLLFIYAFVCYFAIKKLKSGKMLLSVIALFPTSLFLATNYSYDYWVTCFSFLGLSYYYSELSEPLKPISYKDTFIMCGSLFLACIPKAVYLTLLFIPLFMPRKKISGKARYYLTCFGAFAVLFGIMFAKALSSVSGPGDLRGGSEINPSEQLAFIMGKPFEYMGIMFKFMLKYISISTMPIYISNFAYMGVGKTAFIFIVLIIVLGIIDKNRYDSFTGKTGYKIIAVLFFLGTTAMIITSLYIDFTPVRHTTVNGCQPRYLIPLIFPVAYLMGSFKKNINMGNALKTAVYTASFALCSFSVFYDLFCTTMLKMM